MKRDSALFTSLSIHWATPKALYRELNEEFKFTLDPCPLHGEKQDNGPLLSSWDGERVFCNPPYGPAIRSWIERWNEADLSVYLLPARTDTRWFHDICIPHATEIRFLKGRLCFGDGDGRAPFPSMIIIFDNKPIK